MKDHGQSGTTVSTRCDLPLPAVAAFDIIVGELVGALRTRGLRFEPGPNGSVHEAGVVVGRVREWEPGVRVLLDWESQPGDVSEVELRCESIEAGARVTAEHRHWGQSVGGVHELAGWFAGEVIAPLLEVTAPRAFGDWFTDRHARRPSGADARDTYRDPLYHYPGFRAILVEVALGPEDYLLDVGCGGGAFLTEALRSGCRAAGVDHSPDMVQVARDRNASAIAANRLEIREGRADELPFADQTFTCVTMHGVFGFLDDPVAALREARRVLRPGGRVMILGSEPSLKGTPACPEPIASRMHFYDDDEFAQLARDAGFDNVQVVWLALEQYAREIGIPEEHIPLFAGEGTPFLLARQA